MNLLTILLQGGLNVASDTTNLADTAKELAEGTKEISVWQLVVDGGWYIMIPLALMSIMAIYIYVERYLAVSQATKGEKNFIYKIRDYIHDGKLDAAINLCGTTDNPVARMLEKGISRIGKPMRDISTSIENVGRLEINKLEKRIAILATIAGAAPMIGFLGTTLGMIQTFHEMQFSATIKLTEIAPGIMQAMVTTVGGLIVGIIAYIAYNSIVVKIEKVIHKMEGTSIEFLDLLEEPGN